MTVRRVNESVLGVLERPVLHWVVRQIPPCVLPNHLTAIGILGALLAAAGFMLSRWSMTWLWLSSFGLVANWFGDSLDGTLARLRNIERPRFGFFVDHTSDLFSQFLIFVCLGLSPCAHMLTACFGLIAFLMAFVYTLIGAQVQGTMRITYFGFGPTEIRALLFVGNLLVLAFGVANVSAWFSRLGISVSVSVHDLAITSIAFGAALLLCVLAIREARALASKDPMPMTLSRSGSDPEVHKKT